MIIGDLFNSIWHNCWMCESALKHFLNKLTSEEYSKFLNNPPNLIKALTDTRKRVVNERYIPKHLFAIKEINETNNEANNN